MDLNKLEHMNQLSINLLIDCWGLTSCSTPVVIKQCCLFVADELDLL